MLEVELAERFSLPASEGTSKVTDLGSAIRRHIHPGATIHVAYSDARPNAVLLELARAFAGTDPRFTLVTAGLVNVQHSLIELGLVERVVSSFAGENYPVARPNPALVRAIRDGRVTIEHWSLWSLVARLVAGALGVTHFPVKSMGGSTMGAEAGARGEYIEVQLDESAGPTGLVKALRPDIVLLHGAAADPHGNVVLSAPYGEGHWGSLAAKDGVIACVERIVSTEELREMNTLTRIPGHVVRAVCEVPFGAHPYGFNSPGVPGVSSYVEDEAFVARTLTASRTPEDFRAWIDEWVLGVDSHQEYLEKLGSGRTAELVRAARPEGWKTRVTESWGARDPATPTETQVIVTARCLERAVRERGFDVVLSGVGLANLASWTGAEHLRNAGIDVELMAEIGLYGYLPRPGEPFIFAGQNVPTNKLLTDVMGVLGTLVSGPGSKSIGVIGAGQIDKTGAINSTYGADGGFIVGSGGANDVLSAADEVIITVAHQPGRLVDQVDYITCPGRRVRTIVTDLAVFERLSEGHFVLTAVLPTAGDTVEEAVDAIRGITDWVFEVAEDLVAEPAPTAAELATLRVFDPGLLFLRDRRKVLTSDHR
ncbi:probable glutaconate CoA-transferase (plasmid) [Rhodococcus jostii RHA1]|uniref:Probable glutaconate CoA-transferase n=1 Tax=Rhodococcus jostii (strain RHA1) TaxID=101510 RepID=Q0RV60_RHOJR|nr:probable glutaconate CoA-transferase [Rhodococcus jostii RHA1]